MKGKDIEGVSKVKRQIVEKLKGVEKELVRVVRVLKVKHYL